MSMDTLAWSSEPSQPSSALSKTWGLTQRKITLHFEKTSAFDLVCFENDHFWRFSSSLHGSAANIVSWLSYVLIDYWKKGLISGKKSMQKADLGFLQLVHTFARA